MILSSIPSSMSRRQIDVANAQRQNHGARPDAVRSGREEARLSEGSGRRQLDGVGWSWMELDGVDGVEC